MSAFGVKAEIALAGAERALTRKCCLPTVASFCLIAFMVQMGSFLIGKSCYAPENLKILCYG
jgi:hypothetical protein